eukprot:267778-Rhodomonas_salina.1
MARQTVRHPAAQHTGQTEWPDKLSEALQHSTQARWNGQTNYQMNPAQHTGRIMMEWPDKMSDPPHPPASSTAHRLAGWNIARGIVGLVKLYNELFSLSMKAVLRRDLAIREVVLGQT